VALIGEFIIWQEDTWLRVETDYACRMAMIPAMSTQTATTKRMIPPRIGMKPRSSSWSPSTDDGQARATDITVYARDTTTGLPATLYSAGDWGRTLTHP
jgi:hypothetical protein